MTPEPNRRVFELFDAALQVPEADRVEFLRRECDDPEIREMVMRLLARDHEANLKDFLRPPGSTQEATPLFPMDPREAARRGHHLRCPHCREAIEVVGIRANREVTCAVCRSTFRVDDDTPMSEDPESTPAHLGRFTLMKWLGEGSFGTVYKAYDPRLDRLVALKVPRLGNLGTTRDREGFYREARNSAALTHDSIVKVLEVDEVEGTVYIASDFVEGTTLADRLRDRANLPTFPETAEIVIGLANALDYAHKHHVIHRDVKPSNVMLNARGRPLLMDFGLAKKNAAEITISMNGRPLGTPEFMSPEQARGDAATADGRSDVYSLGVLLYQMLTGELPFRGIDRMVIHRVLNEDPRPPRRLNDRIPADLETICLKAMHKEPASRYQTAGDFAADLDRYRKHWPILARPTGRVEKSWRWCRRNPWLAAVTGVAMTSLLGTAILSTRFAIISRQMLNDWNRSLASGNFTSGRAAFERGDVGAGLLWMERCRDAALRAGDLNWARLARLNLAAWGHVQRRLLKILPHAGDVRTASFSPDGKHFLTAGHDGMARLWDATGRPVGDPLHHGDRIQNAVFSPDGSTIVTAGLDGTARLWDVATTRPRNGPLRHNDKIRWAALNADGKILITASVDGVVKRWDVTTGSLIGEPLKHPSGITHAAFSPDGTTILTAGEDMKLQLWDTGAGKPRGEAMPLDRLVWSAAFSRDGKTVATGGEDRKATLREVASGRVLHTIPLDGVVWSLAFSPEGRTLVTGTDGRAARLWDVATATPIGAPMPHADRVWSAAFSPDGKTVMTAGWDQSARLWDALTGAPIGQPCRHQGVINTVAFSPDGKTVLTASADRTARLWDLVDNDPLVPRSHGEGVVLAESMSADGKRLAIGTKKGEAFVYDTKTGKPVGVPLLHGGQVCAVELSRDGKLALTGSLDGKARLWRVDSGQSLGKQLSFDGPINVVTFSPDGKTAAITSADGTALLCDLNTFQARGPILHHTDAITCAVFLPDGKTLITGGDDMTARIWDTATGKAIGTPIPHANKIMGIAASPDGKTFLTACMDGSARFWDAPSGSPRGRPLTHQGTITSAVFSSDGKTVLTASVDGTARLWDAINDQHPSLRILNHDKAVLDVAFSPDGLFAITGCADNTVRLWDTVLGLPIGPPLIHPARPRKIAISLDGLSMMTGCYDNTMRHWNLSHLYREPKSITSLTGLKLLDDRGEIEIPALSTSTPAPAP